METFIEREDWGCGIEKVNNGYIVTTKEVLSDDSITKVYQDDGSELGNEKAFLRILYDLSAIFACDIHIKATDKNGKKIVIPDGDL
jgi:hypothetical protein